MIFQRRPVFLCHPERSDCAFAIAKSKDLPPSRLPHSRSNHSTGESLPTHTPEARP